MESLTLQEQLTLSFYEFDYLNKGYYLADSVIDIEPPYIPPFSKLSKQNTADDGIEPSFLKLIGNLFKVADEEEIKEEVGVKTISITIEPELVGFSCSFPNGQDISAPITLEFINQLSFTETPISFEIIGTYETITFQIVCDKDDLTVIRSQIKAFFPTIMMCNISAYDIGFDLKRLVGIVDFGIDNESLIPIATTDNYNFDPLTPFIATLDNLHQGDTAMLQIMFKGVSAPFSYGMQVASNDGAGGSFFEDFNELPKLCTEKTSYPLFATIIRVVAQGSNQQRTNTLGRELIRNISNISQSAYNNLIPLSNKGYEYENGHLKNVYYRQSNRLGMILSSKEIATFFHFPNKTLVSRKLNTYTGNTKAVKSEYIGNKYILGFNEYNGITETVSITEKTFGRHTLLAGATGSGKTHALKQLIQQSIQNPNVATFCIDGHGDLVSDLLLNIKEEHKENIVFINIADADFSFGFNIFSAESEAEKGVLASDIISSFQNTFISTGDRINAVLQKTISTLIYSEKEASILDMKRFLLEKDFRTEYLKTLDDPILQYYWKNEFSLVKRHELSPLLLRIDSYMQTRLLRNFFAVRKGIDFSKLVAEKKTILIQLSVGLIGLENSKFIANLIVSKITQIAFSRASISQEQRHPIHLCIDESHYYANTPNIEQILIGARKYSLNLSLVGQHLEQFETKILNSILTNTATQIFFRQNDKDARRIASSFSHFEADDFMELGLGEALVKIDKRSNDFNLKTFPLQIYNEPNEAERIKKYIIKNSQDNYATPVADVKELLNEYLPKNNIVRVSKKSIEKEVVEVEKTESDSKEQKRIAELKTTFEKEKTTPSKISNFENQKKEYLEQAREQEVLRKHRSLQHYVRSMAQQRGFKATFEQETKDKGRVDVALLKDKLRIAIEISVSNTKEYEVKNIQKCIDDNFALVYMISDNEKHLQNIKDLALKIIDKKHHSIIHFFKSEDLSIYLDATEPKVKVIQKRIRGYRVKVNYSSSDNTEKQQSITNIIMKALRKK